MSNEVINTVCVVGLIIIVTCAMTMFFGAIAKEFGRDTYRLAKRRRHGWLLRWQAHRQMRGLTSEDFDDWIEEDEPQDGSD